MWKGSSEHTWITRSSSFSTRSMLALSSSVISETRKRETVLNAGGVIPCGETNASVVPMSGRSTLDSVTQSIWPTCPILT